MMTLNRTALRGLIAKMAIAAAALVTVLATALPSLAQSGEYRLRPGDVLRIEVLEDAGLNRAALVAPDGRITLPLAGSVVASGRTVEAVQSELITKLAPNFTTPPTVFVSIERISERTGGTGVAVAPVLIEVHILGEAANPGKIEVKPGTTVLQAFAQMGGFTKFAAKKRIQLRRSGKVYALDYVAIENGRSAVGDTVLAEGDVILIPQRRLFE